MLDPVLAVKALVAIPGGIVAWKSYQAFKRRQRDPKEPRDATTDRWWRAAGYALAVILACLVIVIIGAGVGASGQIITGLFGIIGIAVVVLFAAACILGWRGSA